MEEETFNDEYYCGPWNDLVELIEVSSKRIVDIERHMYPYSERRKWHLFKDRNSELFSLLALVRKLKSLISQKLANVSKQMLYTERDNVENISYRLGLLLRSDLQDKAARCYQLIQPLPQEEIEEQIWHRQAVGTDQDCLIDAAFGIISEIQPQELVKRIFSQISSICKMIDNPPEADDQTKEEALRKEISQRKFSYKQDFEKAQVAFIFDRNHSGTIYDLTNEDNLHILLSLKQSYENKVCANQKFGDRYKLYKVHGFDIETIALFHYHARDVQYFLNDLVKLIIAERKVKELECQIEEQSKLHEQQDNSREQTDNNQYTCTNSVEKEQEFKKRLKEAYDECQQAGSNTYCILLAALCAHGDLKEGSPWVKDNPVKRSQDFPYWLSTMVDDFKPTDEEIKNVKKDLGRFTNDKHEDNDYLGITGTIMLDLFIKNHYANPNDQRAIDSCNLAGRIYNILDGLDEL